MTQQGVNFAGEAFKTASPGEAVPGAITVDYLRLRFVAETLNLEIPLTRLEITKDETTEGRLCFWSMDQQDWIICTFDSRILQHQSLRHQPHTRNQIQALEASGEIKRRVMICLVVLGAFAVVAVIFSALSGVAVRRLVAKIPPAWEQELGDDLITELKEKKTFVQDPKLIAKLDRAVDPLVSSLPRSQIQYKFYLVDEPFANAFALPGGHVVVTTRLLEMAERPEEIAGVVAHEVAHVTEKHGFRQIIASAGPFLIFHVFLGGGSSGVLPVLGESSELLVRQSFSQEFELEADEIGWQSLVAAHIDPRGLAEMLGKLEAEDQKKHAPGTKMNAFSSHPATEKRIRRLDAKWKKLKDKSGFKQL